MASRLLQRTIAVRDAALILGLAGLGVAAGGSLYDMNSVREAIEAFYANAGSELISIAVTVLIIDTLNQRRETQRLKERLIREMGSTDNSIALRAVGELRAHGWLADGSLQGAYLQEANLQAAVLNDANLQETDLFRANLQEARLVRANLQAAQLDGANLQEARLVAANLQAAGLVAANLQAAWLEGANLQGVDLYKANLQNAQLESKHFGLAIFDEETTLPDGTKWSPETDMARFTDPDHPQFWRSDDPGSPAYGG